MLLSTYTSGYDCPLLAFFSMGDEDRLIVEKLYRILTFVISASHKSFETVVAIVHDNNSSQQNIWKIFSAEFHWLLQHSLYVTSALYQSKSRQFFEYWGAVEQAFIYTMPIANLDHVTHLRAKVDNKTWRSSTFELPKRYGRIQTITSHLNLDILSHYNFEHEGDATIDVLFAALYDPNSVSVKLQNPVISLGYAQILFDGRCQCFSSTNDRLKSNSSHGSPSLWVGNH